MAKVLRPDGSTEMLELVSGQAVDVQLRELVGGWLEMVGLGNGEYMVIDEEGKLKGCPYNHQATVMASHVLQWGDCIVGIAVVVSRQELGE